MQAQALPFPRDMQRASRNDVRVGVALWAMVAGAAALWRPDDMATHHVAMVSCMSSMVLVATAVVALRVAIHQVTRKMRPMRSVHALDGALEAESRLVQEIHQDLHRHGRNLDLLRLAGSMARLDHHLMVALGLANVGFFVAALWPCAQRWLS